MPNYDYKCEKCSHEFELFQTMTEDPASECPVCQGPVKRLIGGGAGLIFKGSGFYITDYKKKNNNSSGATSENKSSGGEKKKSEKKKKDES